MVLPTKTIQVSDIIVEDRFREDMGPVDELAANIAEKGLLHPILLSPKLRLLAGGRRLMALKMLQITELSPEFYRIIGTETRLDELEIELIENIQRKEMTWAERAKLEESIFEHKRSQDENWTQEQHSQLLDQSHGSTSRRLALAKYIEVVPDLANARTEDDAWKKVKKLEERLLVQHMEKIQDGEVDPNTFQWAEDHYIVGDALQKLKKGPKGTAHFAEVDPPYAVNLDKRKAKNKSHEEQMLTYNEVPVEEYRDFLRKTAELTYLKLADHSFCIWWFGMTWLNEVREILRETGFKVNDIPCIWYKPGVGQTSSPDTMLGSSYEPFFVARKGMPKLRKAGRSNVFEFAPVPASKKIHPTERPSELMCELLGTFAYPGARIVVPFLGSGATLRAGYKLGHVGFGYDLSAENKQRFLDRVKLEFFTAPERNTDPDEESPKGT